jgi:hypothetical protein
VATYWQVRSLAAGANVFLAIFVQAEIDEKTPRKTSIPADILSSNQLHEESRIAASLPGNFAGWFERLSMLRV